ncbi:MAG: tripartite tricarboxylate transporter permease [Armatimonadota bacterium]|nr:tripartite tricarboxylate transporter permease [Armatimonadota bacterium]MDR7534419.1 tripartite tricarboxylate transporter permease [Armatimonadota bacterium]MDR7535732.1 tripartite tricarboxylate transporter permease [Armatimonadota bacterium]
MLEALLQALVEVLQWQALRFMLIGIAVGFWVGLLPGLGGGTTLALMLPFVYRMEPVAAFAFLLGMHAVVATTGDITSILFGIPGEGTTAATVLDGHAMAKRGEAGRALGAALGSSLVGAVVGAAALAAAIPVVRPLVLTFGSPELFMLAVLGIAFIASLSGRSPRAMLRGFLAGALGLMIAAVGSDPQAGNHRYTLGTLYLWDGLDLVPVLVGFFAIPEIIDLAVRGTAIAGQAPAGRLAGVAAGVRDVFRHFWLTIRCSLIGTYIGIIPGLGGGVAQWLAYAHAAQSVRSPHERAAFGTGDVRGVLGPGAANNSKEGGALIPTVAFGVPGSSAMAILLGGFFLVGLTPGPDMLTRHLNVTLSMVWTIVLANIVTVAVCLVFLHHLARLTTIRGTLLIPVLVLLTFVGAYTANNSLGDVVVMLAFGALGYLMVRYQWPRAPLVLGLVLGDVAERYLWISVARYGAAWLGRPVVVALMVLVAGVVLSTLLQQRRGHRRTAAEAVHAT